ncbi:hypothetical protein NA57DRAFT_46441 [Rhizodiscina lignyota]|uniref:Uncharacterized protein n=1 Tax=Rhizodiscina lignyota TaxID=1504668 RepID=A0A9P4I440_9PEZI|nr:hypothetical protein NA57DRAFT_46441 [Rhizodiscina lignyota]
MVLEDSTADSTGFQPDAAPSDTDRYSTNNATNAYPIDLSTLSKPAPIIGPLLGYSQSYRLARISETCAGTSRLMQRPLTGDEVQAIAEMYSKVLSRSSWGDVTGIGVGAYFCYKGAPKYRFPFYSPDLEKFNPNELGALRGQMARMGWHALRAIPYVTLFGLLGDFVFRNSAILTAMATLQRDKRLKEINEKMQRRMTHAIEEAQKRRENQKRGLPQQQHETSEGVDIGNTDGVAPHNSTANRRGRDDFDDMSPTGGAFTDSFGSGTDASVLSDEQMRVHEMQQRAEGDRTPTRQTHAQPQQQPDRQDSFDFESTSQPAPASQGSQSAQSSSSSESAWARIRRQVNSSEQSGPSSQQSGGAQREQSQGSTLGGSFSFSSAEEERQLAKTEAQKEFDARIERERQGKDFGGDARSKRW